ncbi:protein FAM161A-like [Harmonia axyridis]|uniref:protein FAM161A-like n=1 Tax=Harmonia axyridis TaxID=115357 RepID=UPI001E279690|nr:protein FAM161A-like [Harmonia axyridis]
MSLRNSSASNASSRSRSSKPKYRRSSQCFEQKYLNELENEARKLSIESNEIKLKNKRLQEAGSKQDVTKTFLEFFGSIPEYDDVNHLSNRDFYKKLENLREKQKQYSDYLQTELKLTNRDTEWINDYQMLKLGSKMNDNKLSPPQSKPFCMTPILSKKSKNMKNYEDLELLSLSDRETKPPSRRSVRIETPFSAKSDKSSSNSSFRSLKRAKSTAPSSPLDSSKEPLGSEKSGEELLEEEANRKENSCPLTNCGITIPKPFQMTVRDEENEIVEKCMTELNTNANKEKQEMFRAHPVPIESQIPLFDKLMADQEYKNHLVRERRKADLNSQMRPFSFTKRDEEMQVLSKRLSKSSPCIFPEEKEVVKKFRAKPVPKNLFSNYIYHKMYEDEFYRSLQKKIRSAEMLKAASLPPSMAKREQNKKIYDVCPKSYKTMTYSDEFPEFMRSKKIPDFKKFHDLYEKELEDLKNEFISTSPRPFKFRRSKSKCKKDNKTISSGSSSRTTSASGLRAVSRSNLAAVLRIESARKRLQDHMDQKLEEARVKEEARWREKIMRKKPVWESLAYSNEEDLQMRLRMRKDEERLRKEEHRLRMELMFGRVNQQPTLFERQSQIKYPKTKEEIIEAVYRENNVARPKRSVSDLSGNYYYNGLKDEGVQVSRDELEDIELEKALMNDEDKDKFVVAELEEE